MALCLLGAGYGSLTRLAMNVAEAGSLDDAMRSGNSPLTLGFVAFNSALLTMILSLSLGSPTTRQLILVGGSILAMSVMALGYVIVVT